MRPINNPGNLRPSLIPWRGETSPLSSGGFVQFRTLLYGIRAMYKTLHTYAHKYSLYSAADVISRYAPASENDTASYIRFVEETLARYPQEDLYDSSDINRNPRGRFALLLTMIAMESGPDVLNECIDALLYLFRMSDLPRDLDKRALSRSIYFSVQYVPVWVTLLLGYHE